MYNWTYASLGGNTRVRIASGEDIRHLGELDQKMWTVLSCPTKGLELDERTLTLLDTDSDERVRVNEVVKASQWLCSVLRDPDVLLDGKDCVKVEDILDEALAAVAKEVAGEDSVITLAAVEAAIAAKQAEAAAVALKPLPEAPLAADVMAAYKECKAAYDKYFQDEKLQAMGLYSIPAETPVPGMSAEKWAEMSKQVADYEAACAQIEAENAAATAVDVTKFEPLKKLLLLCRDFHTLLRNYVALEDFYNKSQLAIFQAGTLIIDQRACHLCVRVEDMGKQDAQAPASSMYLVYCQCTSKKLGQTMQIVAAVTCGDIHNLMVGKNAIFYDRKGNDWDAVVTKIIDNPISIKQAFWSPYRKFANWVKDLIDKSAAEKDAKALDDMKAKASEHTVNLKTEDGQAKKEMFDIAKFAGIFAAIGMALGYIGAFITSIATGIASLTWWQFPLVVIGLMLCISGPSMFIAWTKLRRRNIAPILNANGWAVNAEAIVNVPFGATLTEQATFPILKKVRGK